VKRAATSKCLLDTFDRRMRAPILGPDPVPRAVTIGLPRHKGAPVYLELAELLFSEPGEKFGTSANPNTRETADDSGEASAPQQ
jgi:hypothetical protein